MARELRPQPGPQLRFLASTADVVVYGGGAGGGKTYGMLIEPLRYMGNAQFNAVYFRRESKQIKNAGGLWDTALDMYQDMGIKTNLTDLSISWPSGAKLTFAHLQLERDKYSWQGSQISLIGFDELAHFSKGQFQYLLSRNRSTCGVKPYVRCTTNPDPDSWVRDLVAWWIDEQTGLPIAERDGKVRYCTILGSNWIWGDTAKEVRDKTGQDPISFTFIRALITDNPALMKADPSYLAKLNALEPHERERLLGGNWNARPQGKLYSRSMFDIVDAMPEVKRQTRGWDFAATIEKPGTDPDYTASVKIAETDKGWVIMDMTEDRLGPDEVEDLLRTVSKADAIITKISIPQDPGSAGKIVVARYIRMLGGFDVEATPETGSKLERSKPFMAQARAGNIKLLAGEWNRRFLNSLESFGTSAHDDIADATHRAFNSLADVGGADAYLTFLGGEVQAIESRAKEAIHATTESGRRVSGWPSASGR